MWDMHILDIHLMYMCTLCTSWFVGREFNSQQLYFSLKFQFQSLHLNICMIAMPTSMKTTVLTQELLRVMVRCIPLLEWSRVTEHLNGMMRHLQFSGSGYNQSFKAQVLKTTFKVNDNIKQEVAEGVRLIYCQKGWNRKGREEKKRKRESLL